MNNFKKQSMMKTLKSSKKEENVSEEHDKNVKKAKQRQDWNGQREVITEEQHYFIRMRNA